MTHYQRTHSSGTDRSDGEVDTIPTVPKFRQWGLRPSRLRSGANAVAAPYPPVGNYASTDTSTYLPPSRQTQQNLRLQDVHSSNRRYGHGYPNAPPVQYFGSRPPTTPPWYTAGLQPQTWNSPHERRLALTPILRNNDMGNAQMGP